MNDVAGESPAAAEIQWLGTILTGQIPLGGAMQLQIEVLDAEGIELAAPLAPNVNDKGTAFGGALVSMMILAGWSLPRLLLQRRGLDADLVIGRCQVRFIEPVEGPFRAVCRWPPPDRIAGFIDQLRQRGRGRLELEPEIIVEGGVAARLQARYAALAKPEKEDRA